MPSTPESEETRPTSEEIEAAAKVFALEHHTDGEGPCDFCREKAAAMLEAAAALRQPREGAGGEIDG